MFDMLTRLFELVFDFVPRLYIVEPTERAVRFCLGRYGRVCQPGWHFYWPVIMTVDSYCTVSQLVETAILSCHSHDGESYQIRLAVEYRVSRAMRFHLKQHDGQLHIEMTAGSTMVALVNALDSSEIQEKGSRKLCRVVRERIKGQIEERGATILSVRTVMFDRCFPIFLSQAERLAD